MTTAAKEMFDDLLSLEVNLIVKPGMTGRKMPNIPQALLDIFGDYDVWLCVLAGRLNVAWERFRASPDAAAFLANPPPESLLVVGEALIGGLQHTTFFETGAKVTAADFDTLRTEARTSEELYKLLITKHLATDDGSLIILKRIFRNCDQIKGILDGRGLGSARDAGQIRSAANEGLSRADSNAGDLPLGADEVLVVRKAWEIGTETVAMQTVAQLDGDVITRIQEARLTAANKPLHDLHRDAVANALEHWQFLFTTFVQITTKAAGFLVR